MNFGKEVITSAKAAAQKNSLTLSFYDGKIDVNTLKNKKKKQFTSSDSQLSLLDLVDS